MFKRRVDELEPLDRTSARVATCTSLSPTRISNLEANVRQRESLTAWICQVLVRDRFGPTSEMQQGAVLHHLPASIPQVVGLGTGHLVYDRSEMEDLFSSLDAALPKARRASAAADERK